jgi:hypothetical protein
MTTRETVLLERLDGLSDDAQDVHGMIDAWDDVKSHPTVKSVMGMVGIAQGALSTARDLVRAEHHAMPELVRGRTGEPLMTATGGRFWPLDPRAEEVTVEDLVLGLVNKCRFNGLIRRFYDVGRHSANVAICASWLAHSRGLGEEIATACYEKGLAHDGHEAYLFDPPRPVKPYIRRFNPWAQAIQTCIESFLGFGIIHNSVEVVQIVDEADELILWAEMQALYPHVPASEWAFTPPASYEAWEASGVPLNVEHDVRETLTMRFNALRLAHLKRVDEEQGRTVARIELPPKQDAPRQGWKDQVKAAELPEWCMVCEGMGQQVPVVGNGLCGPCGGAA